MLNAQLKVLGGKHDGKVIPLTVKKFLIGREQDCHLRPNSDSISRHHCVLTIDEFGVHARDLGSTNGSFLNDERIHGHVAINSGDILSVGKLKFVVIIREPASVTAEEPSDAEPDSFILPAEGGSPSETMTEIPVLQTGGDNDETSNTTVFSGDTTISKPDEQDIPASAPPVEQPEPISAGATPPEQVQNTAPEGQVPPQPVPGQPYPYPYPVAGQPGQPAPYPQQPMMMPPGYVMQTDASGQPIYYQPMPGAYPPGTVPPGQFPPGQYPPGQYPPGQVPPGQMPPQPTPTEEPASEGKAKPKVESMPLRLPNPEETGVREGREEPGSAGSPTEANESSSDEQSDDPSKVAADIIRQYRSRRESDDD